MIVEKAEPTARRDLEEFFDHLVSENSDYFRHSFESSDDIPSYSHGLTRTSEKMPILDGKMQLGTWQGIFLFEDRHAPYRRKLFLTVTGE